MPSSASHGTPRPHGDEDIDDAEDALEASESAVVEAVVVETEAVEGTEPSAGEHEE